MTASGSVVGAAVLLLSFLASIDLFSSSLIKMPSAARAGMRPAHRHSAMPAGSVYTQRRTKSGPIGTPRARERIPRGKPGTASQFQRRELVAVPVLRGLTFRAARFDCGPSGAHSEKWARIFSCAAHLGGVNRSEEHTSEL